MNWIIAAALFACLVQSPAVYGAEAFPDRPIKLVVPSPPGGPPDIMARLLTDEMSVALGEPVVVENRAGGAGGLIGARTVLGAEPDGYTILMGSTSALLTAPLIYKDAGYNAASFAPIANLSETVEVLSVNPSVPAHSPEVKPEGGGFTATFISPTMASDNIDRWVRIKKELFN